MEVPRVLDEEELATGIAEKDQYKYMETTGLETHIGNFFGDTPIIWG